MFRFKDVNDVVARGRAGAASTYIGDGAVLCRVLDRFKMFVPSDDLSLSPHLILDGCWEPWITRFVADMIFSPETTPGAQPMTVINVGANVGYYTLMAALLVGRRGRVLAVEADQRLAHCIARNLQVNGLDDVTDVVVAAAWDRSDIMIDVISPDKNLMGSTFCEEAQGRQTETPGFDSIQSKTIDDLVSHYQMEPPDLLIIDAEGSEPRVLRGAIGCLAKPGIQVVMEWMGDRPEYGQEFFDWIRDEQGFEVYLINSLGRLDKVGKPPTAPICNVYLKRSLSVIDGMKKPEGKPEDQGEPVQEMFNG